MSSTSLAAVLIVKNEAAQLGDCLASVADWVDEIVIVDSGSTDATESIAQRFHAHFIRHTDWQGFGTQRQRAQAQCTADWLFWIDADELVTPELKQSIQAAVRANRTDTLYRVSRLSWVFGRFIRHSGWYPDRVVRLYPRQMTQFNNALVHESVIVPERAQCIDLKGDLLHFTYRDMTHYLVKSAHYAKAWADKQTLQNRRTSLLQGLIHGIGCFVKMYLIRQGFRDGQAGLLLALLSAHSTFVKYADLWVRHQPPSPQTSTHQR